MEQPLGHSARFGCGEQSYVEHVFRVTAGSALRTGRMLRHRRPLHGDPPSQELLTTALASGAFHDLGKLDPGFQETLRTNKRSENHIRHEDAGVVYLGEMRGLREAAGLVSSHHQGLVEYKIEVDDEELNLNPSQKLDISAFRCDQKGITGSATKARLNNYLDQHSQLFGEDRNNNFSEASPLSGFTRRLLLSCLVDADHTDTARHYGQIEDNPRFRGRWKERLASLDAYVSSLQSPESANKSSSTAQERATLRSDFYSSCRYDTLDSGIVACDAPVGSGKTTALMAYLLRLAEKHRLRHIFVVLPFTNIIKQSVEVYRNALRLPDESAEDMKAVVAEHHHQVEFETLGLRNLTTRWQAPIIITTAVQFFETLAACKTSRLRKLHELPGSAVFLDEAHAALPAALWPVCWRWFREWVNGWNGHIMLASGSLPTFWEIDEIRSIVAGHSAGTATNDNSERIPFVASKSVAKTKQLEKSRVCFETISEPLSGNSLIERVEETIRRENCPSLVVVNTVQAAAALARSMRKQGIEVLHLSTALAPCHRAIIIERIKEMLRYRKRWVLAATSLVEAGIDFSFGSAFRQRASAMSLLQIGGRVNRNAEKDRPSNVWDFDLIADEELSPCNPQLQASVEVLQRMFADGMFEDGDKGVLDFQRICLTAMKREFSPKKQDKAGSIIKAEKFDNYPEVAKSCRVIDSDSHTVIIDPELAEAVGKYLAGKGKPVAPSQITHRSVQMYHNRINQLGLESIGTNRADSEIYKLPSDWGYDPDFLGYMDGFLSNCDHRIPSGFLA